MVIPCKKYNTEDDKSLLKRGVQKCISAHLDKDSKQNKHYGGCDEESFLWEIIDQER